MRWSQVDKEWFQHVTRQDESPGKRRAGRRHIFCSFIHWSMSFAQLKQARSARQAKSAVPSTCATLQKSPDADNLANDSAPEQRASTSSATSSPSVNAAVKADESNSLEKVASIDDTNKTSDTSLDASTASETLSTSATSTSQAPSLDTFIDGLDSRNDLYAILPPHLFIKRSNYAGRGVFTSKSIKASSQLFTTPLHASVLSTPHLAAYCSACYSIATPDKTLKRCARCQVVHYCSPVRFTPLSLFPVEVLFEAE
jgi:hypothetical protein